MEWMEAYGPQMQPQPEQIDSFIGSPHWKALCGALEETYNVRPKYSYSGCSMQAGWNVKYQKGGRALCTLYPMAGYFIAMVVIGAREQNEAELMLPMLSEYTRAVYRNTNAAMDSRWLMLDVRDGAALEDVLRLIALRAGSKPKPKAG